MKNVAIGLLVFLTFSVAVAKPPKAVVDAFKVQYPTVKKTKWKKEDGAWEVHFRQKGTEISATYKANGSLVETEKTIRETELPASVLEAARKRIGKAKIKEAAIITRANGEQVYEVETKGRDFFFKADGTEVK